MKAQWGVPSRKTPLHKIALLLQQLAEDFALGSLALKKFDGSQASRLRGKMPEGIGPSWPT